MMVERVVLDRLLLVVLFQAEDGIRDLVRSRGLGDVYKRQVRLRTARRATATWPVVPVRSSTTRQAAVSYTHLTLPTSDLV